MVPEVVASPGAFAAGHRLRSALAVGLIRPPGIELPEKTVGVALLPGQAPSAFTEPAQGSTIGVLMAEKSPLRSAVLGTVVVNGSPVRNRKPSQLANQNVRLRPS